MEDVNQSDASVKEPVRFYESIVVMQDAGVTNFIEMQPWKGPIRLCQKLIKQLKKHVEDQASLMLC